MSLTNLRAALPTHSRQFPAAFAAAALAASISPAARADDPAALTAPLRLAPQGAVALTQPPTPMHPANSAVPMVSETPANAGGATQTSGRIDAAAPPVTLDAPRLQFLDQGKWNLTLGAGVANDFKDSTDSQAFVQVSTFLAPRFEVGLELGGWYFAQKGKDAAGSNLSLAFKYHVYATEDRAFTAFAEVGIGILVATRRVPAGGTNFDFMPRVGGGVTYRVADGARLVGGVRWHHISNAEIAGDNRNPGRDGIMGYLGLEIELN